MFWRIIKLNHVNVRHDSVDKDMLVLNIIIHEIVVEIHRERLVRVDFGSQALTGGSPDKLHPRCRKMSDLLARQTGKSDLASLQTFFSEPSFGICAGKSTIDMMVFDCTERAAYLSRGPEYGVAWKTFAFSRR